VVGPSKAPFSHLLFAAKTVGGVDGPCFASATLVSTPQQLGRYRIIAELGQGGMAEVFLTMVAGPSGSGFSKLAVVKRLRPNLVEDPDFVAMLVDEARISARLSHPNVVQTLEVGVENEEYFLAMEFLDGQPMHRIQRRVARTKAAFSEEMAFLVVIDTLAGLHHAHELADYDGTPLNIVHRDVTPQNIFVTYDGTVKVVDFGIAKAAGRVQETKAGIVKGKVRYMSPEQAVGGEVDRRSDIFAAGVLLWEAATGMRFWRGEDDMTIVQRLVAGTYDASPRSAKPTVAPEIDAICRKAMSFNKEDRYATADELRTDIESFLGGRIVSARRKLGAAVSEMFASERTQVRQVIERAGRTAIVEASMTTLLSGQTTIAPPGATPRSPHSSSTHVMATSIAPPQLASIRPLSASLGTDALAPTGQGPHPYRGLFAGALAAAAAVVVALIAFPFGVAERVGRMPSQVEHVRTSLLLTSATHLKERILVEVPVERSETATAPVAFARPVTVTHSEGPVSSPVAAAASPSARHTDVPEVKARRAKPSLDLADPWTRKD
jgi:serine/threonine protein kinase